MLVPRFIHHESKLCCLVVETKTEQGGNFERIVPVHGQREIARHLLSKPQVVLLYEVIRVEDIVSRRGLRLPGIGAYAVQVRCGS